MAERRDVIKNKKAILQGYIDMTNEKVIDKITVSDVIKKANVSRATFYAHYSDINALKDRFENDFMAMMIRLCHDSIQNIFMNSEQSVLNIFSAFDKNRKMIQAICGNGSSESFFLLFKEAFQKEIVELIHRKDSAASDIIALTIASLITDNCRDIVLNRHNTIDNGQRAKIISKFIPKK